MSESGKQSGEDDESYSGSSEEDDWDPSYDYTGEESGLDDDDEEEERAAEFSDDDDDDDGRGVVDRLRGDEEDWQYCEQGAVPRRLEPPQVYAPDRGPPLLDFLFVLTAFFAAVFAAYYTIFTETGLS